MPHDLLFPDDIDRAMKWPAGRALKLAKAGKLPHVKLPDDSIRFIWSAITAMIHCVPATGTTVITSASEVAEVSQ